MVDCDAVDAVHCLEDEVRRVGSRDCVSRKYTKGRDLDDARPPVGKRGVVEGNESPVTVD